MSCEYFPEILKTHIKADQHDHILWIEDRVLLMAPPTRIKTVFKISYINEYKIDGCTLFFNLKLETGV